MAIGRTRSCYLRCFSLPQYKYKVPLSPILCGYISWVPSQKDYNVLLCSSQAGFVLTGCTTGCDPRSARWSMVAWIIGWFCQCVLFYSTGSGSRISSLYFTYLVVLSGFMILSFVFGIFSPPPCG